MHCDVLRVSAWSTQDPVGVQAVLPGAGGHWKREAGDMGRKIVSSGETEGKGEGRRAERSQHLETIWFTTVNS